MYEREECGESRDMEWNEFGDEYKIDVQFIICTHHCHPRKRCSLRKWHFLMKLVYTCECLCVCGVRVLLECGTLKAFVQRRFTKTRTYSVIHHLQVEKHTHLYTNSYCVCMCARMRFHICYIAPTMLWL